MYLLKLIGKKNIYSNLELEYLSNALKKTSKALGSFKKKITYSEKKNKKAVRKTYYIKNRILKNSVISLDDLIFKRPFIKENSKVFI